MGCTETPVASSKCLHKLSELTSQPPPVQADSRTIANLLTPSTETLRPRRAQLPALSLQKPNCLCKQSVRAWGTLSPFYAWPDLCRGTEGQECHSESRRHPGGCHPSPEVRGRSNPVGHTAGSWKGRGDEQGRGIQPR